MHQPAEDTTGVNLSTGSRKFVLPISYSSGEGLREATYRACSLNRFPRTRTALHLAECKSIATLSGLSRCDNPTELLSLEKVIGVFRTHDNPDMDRLPEATRSRTFTSFFGQPVRRAHIANLRRISPRALSVNPTMKAIWSLKPLAFDPNTREMLLDRCPVCSNLLQWDFACDPWECSKCVSSGGSRLLATDLRDFFQPLFEPTDEEAADFVSFLLDPGASGRRVFLPVHSPLALESAGSIFQLAVRIASLCQLSATPGRSAAIEPHYIEMAGRALLDWPNGFIDLIDRAGKAPFVGGIQGWFDAKPLRKLLYDPTLPSSIRHKIKIVLDCARRMEAINRPLSTEIVSAPSKLRLQHPRSALLSLVRLENDYPRQSFGHVPLPSIEIEMAVFRDVKEIRQFATTWGITVPELFEIYKSGFAPELQDYLPQSFGPDFKGESLFKRLGERISRRREVSGISLVESRFVLDTQLTGTWASILQAVVDKRLEAWFGSKMDGNLMSQLHIGDFPALRSVIGTGTMSREIRTSPITLGEVAMIIDRSRTAAANLARSARLHGKMSIGRLATFRSDWVLGFELRNICAIMGADEALVKEGLRSEAVKLVEPGCLKLWPRDAVCSLTGFSTS